MEIRESPFFSVIVPVYNCEKYIEDCIKSVVNQTYTSWELILVDDGSTDASGEICDKFCNDSRVRVIHQKNSGELNSRWNGILNAQGKYELGLDADDLLDLNCLEILKRTIDEYNSDLIFFGIRCIGNQKGEFKPEFGGENECSQKEILEIVIRQSNTSLCNKAIKLDKVKCTKIDDSIKEGPRFNLDYALIIPILCNIKTGYILNEVLYNYRIHGESISHLGTVQHILDTGIVTEYVKHTLESASLIDAELIKWINITYLNTIWVRIIDLFAYDKITRSDCNKIHASNSYMDSRAQESFRYFHSCSDGVMQLIILKLFRYRKYGLLKLTAKILRRHELRDKER